MDFEEAERSEPTQALELGPEDIREDGIIQLRYVKFQNVNSVTVSAPFPGGALLPAAFGLLFCQSWDEMIEKWLCLSFQDLLSTNCPNCVISPKLF